MQHCPLPAAESTSANNSVLRSFNSNVLSLKSTQGILFNREVVMKSENKYNMQRINKVVLL